MLETANVTPTEPLLSRIDQVCDAIGAFVAYWGFKAIHGRVWGLLALHVEPLSQADIARKLGVSRALVSAVVAELCTYGLVRAVGDARQAPYEAVMDVWPTISDVLRSREWMLLETARGAMEAASEELAQCHDEGRATPYSAQRLKFLLTMTELAQTLLKTLMALRSPRSAFGLRQWSSRAALLFRGLRS